jgi:hypothetical protein
MENQEKPMERVSAFATDKLKISEFRESIKGDYEGKICPTCNRWAKEEKVKLNEEHCLALLHIFKYYRYNDENKNHLDYFHSTEMFSKNDHFLDYFSDLEYWDLIEAKGELVNGEFVKENNFWRISENGIKFAQREIAVPIYAILYDGVVQGHQLQPYATIDEIIGINDYQYNKYLDPNTLIE